MWSLNTPPKFRVNFFNPHYLMNTDGLVWEWLIRNTCLETYAWTWYGMKTHSKRHKEQLASVQQQNSEKKVNLMMFFGPYELNHNKASAITGFTLSQKQQVLLAGVTTLCGVCSPLPLSWRRLNSTRPHQ